MKVLQLTAVDFTVKKLLLPLVDEMIAQGYEVHIACFVDEIGEGLRNENYILHHIPFKRNLNLLSHVSSLLKLLQLMRKERYAIVHTHTPVASLIGRLAAKLTRIPLIVYTAHGFYFHEHMGKLAFKIHFALEKLWARAFTDQLFLQSKEDYQFALDNNFKQANRLHHINNGVSKVRFNPKLFDTKVLKEKYQITDKLAFAFVGRLVEEKGLKELLNAFAKVSENRNDLVLMVIGGASIGDRDTVQIEDLLNTLPAETRNNIKFMGLRDNIPELLAAVDIFVLPSYREGLPRSIIEAMAMGKPIIATNIRGCREEVQDGVNGFLCTPKSSTSLANAMEKMIENKDQREEMGRTGREIFLREYDEERVLERQMTIFNRYRKNHLKG
ncbi:glycosyltransferase family 4 protein [Sporosarcina sp. UB5]|uniref:glycosyltransferase family 4 protein n=1 Tax=Sporosarcina sp. UB5 TaxID=3047463 RepID=UPI003D7B9351